MSPEEEIAYLQQERDRLVKDLEIAREAEARQQATAQPVPHESPQLLEAKVAQCEELIKEAEARQTEQTRDAVEIQGRLADAQYEQTIQLATTEPPKTLADVLQKQAELEHQETVAEVGHPTSVDHPMAQSVSAGPEMIAVVTGMFVAQKAYEFVEPTINKGIDKFVELADSFTSAVDGTRATEGAKEVADKAKEVTGKIADKAITDMFPDQTKDLHDIAARHVQEQQELKRDLEALAEKFISAHLDASAEQRAAQQTALEEQARAAREALERQQAAELQLIVERHQTPQVRF